MTSTSTFDPELELDIDLDLGLCLEELFRYENDTRSKRKMKGWLSV
jgi:hypothetical protein